MTANVIEPSAMPRAESRYVAYYRVFTREPIPRGFELDEQRAAVLAHVGSEQRCLAKEVYEMEGGRPAYTLDRRPQLRTAIKLCQTRGTGLLFAKLGRLARNRHFAAVVMESQITFAAADIADAKELMMRTLERPHRRSEANTRTTASPATIIECYTQAIRAVLLSLRARGTSFTLMAIELNMLGVAPPRGVKWDATAVRRVMTQ